MKHIFNILFAYVVLLSCNAKAQESCNISVLNKSAQKIDSIKITSYDLTATFTNLLPNKEVEKLCTLQYKGKNDGAFLISIYVKDSIKNQAIFGYYANSTDIKTKYRIEILADYSIREK